MSDPQQSQSPHREEVHNERWHDGIRSVVRHTFSARGASIVAAGVVDLSLIWLLVFRHAYDPPNGTAEWFFVRVLVGFFLYAALQQWTLPRMSPLVLAATIDKFFALSPFICTIGLDLYWVGHDIEALSWRHHFVALIFGIYSVIDFFSTDIINQLLRERQIGIGTPR
jgi:hypothetical protein